MGKGIQRPTVEQETTLQVLLKMTFICVLYNIIIPRIDQSLEMLIRLFGYLRRNPAAAAGERNRAAEVKATHGEGEMFLLLK